jgi:hypothetical protein
VSKNDQTPLATEMGPGKAHLALLAVAALGEIRIAREGEVDVDL